jgi:hypothetical protein
MVGTRSFGDVDIFLPLWQDQGSLLFGDLRGTFTAQPTEEGNFGLGYRTQISPEWILGGYGYFDIANSANDNLFYQVTLGLELKSVDWDFRLNGYIPINPDGGNISNDSNPDPEIRDQTSRGRSASTGPEVDGGVFRCSRRMAISTSGLCRRLPFHAATWFDRPRAGSRPAVRHRLPWGCSRG